ncbi:MAG: DUF262 domain-containing protein [Synergistaceae bacterium]|nr:DUF262 domain-containing protein [Synergistaceae bacterium]
MDAIFYTTEFTVAQLIEKIDTGELGLPELQRPFVWKNTKIRDLFDSMMSGYPVGYLMLWECPDLDKSKSIGLEGKSYDEPKEVIIDGQQRLTSLYAVMKGKPVVASDFKEKSIVISFSPLEGRFEVGTAAIKNNPEWIYNLSELFTSATSSKYIRKFMKALEDHRALAGLELSDEEQETIEVNIEAVFSLKNYKFPVFMIKSNAEEEAVSQVFVRINSSGTPLRQNDFILTLLSVHWEEGRREIERFCKESGEYSPGVATSFNSMGIEISAQDIIRTVMAYAFGRARLMYGYKLLRGADLNSRNTITPELRERNFSILKAKLPDVMSVNNWHEFLKAIMNAGYLSDSMILSKNAIYYTYSMYLIARDRFNAPNSDNKALSSLWFFHAALTSLYSNSPETVAENHLNAISRLSSLEEYRQFILSRVSERLTDDYFNITLPGSEGLAVSGSGNNAWFAYVASLNILGTKPLFSRSSLPVSTLFMPGADGSRKSLEKHHLFPKAHLKEKGYADTQINQMANYAYIDWNDNMKILDEAPAVYYPAVCEGMTHEEITQMEEENALPHGWESMSYEEFLMQRRRLMAQIIRRAFVVLRGRAENSMC